MTLLSTTGSIRFDGSLTMGRSYRFKTTTGSVEATISQNSSFHVDATVKIGQFTAPDFPTLIAQGMGRGTEVHSEVGTATSSHAELSIEVEMGSISLYQAG